MNGRRYRLLNLLSMLDTDDMISTGSINNKNKELLEAIDRLKIECRIIPLIDLEYNETEIKPIIGE